MNPIVIAKAWIEVLKGTTTDEHKRRASICKGCKHAKHKKYLEFRELGLVEVKGYICTDCEGCPLVAKIRSNKICDKWKTPIK